MTDDINDKLLAVFLAAIMALSMVAVGAVSLGGAAAAQNVGVDETQVDDITIDTGTTIVDDTPRNGTAVYDAAPVYTGGDWPMADGNHVGMTGLPFHEAPYDAFADQDLDGGSMAHQQVSVTFTVGDEAEGEETVIIDIEESIAAGLVVADASFATTGAGAMAAHLDLEVDNAAQEIRLTYDTDDVSGTETATLDLTWVAANPTEGLNSDFIGGDTSVYHILRGPNGDSTQDRYRAVEAGATGIAAGDAMAIIGEETTDGDLDAEGDADGADNPGVFHTWEGQDITLVAEDPQHFITVWEVDEEEDNDDDVWAAGDPVHQTQPYPGHAVTLNVDDIGLEPGEQYFVTFTASDELADGHSDAAVLDVHELSLEAEFREDQRHTEQDIRIDVESAARGGDDVEAWFWEAGDGAIGQVVHVEQGELDGTGETVLRVSPQADLGLEEDESGEFYAAVAHVESEVFVFTDTVSVMERDDAAVTIVSPTGGETFPRGDIIPVELAFENTDVGTFTFGDLDSNVRVDVTVRDLDESGSAHFYINTFQVGHGYVYNVEDDGVPYDANYDTGPSRNHGIFTFDPGTALMGEEGQSAIAHQGMDIQGGSDGHAVLHSMTYDLTTVAGEDPWYVQDRVNDRDVVRLLERDGSSLQVNAAPGTGENEIDPETRDEIEELREGGFINPADGAIADADFLVVEVESDGLTGLLAESLQRQVLDDGGTLAQSQLAVAGEIYDREDDHIITDVFVAATTQTQVIDFGLDSTEQNVPPNVEEVILSLDGERVIAGTDEWGNFVDFFVPIHLESGVTDVSPADRELTPGMIFNTTFTLKPADGVGAEEGIPVNELLASEDESVTETWQFQTPFADVDRNPDTNPMWNPVDDILEVPPSEVDIEGVTNTAAGTNVTVEVETVSGQELAFYRSHTVFIDYAEGAENAWNITEDFSEDPEGTLFTLQFRRAGAAGNINPGGERVAGIIDEAPEVTTFEFNDQEIAREGQVVRVDAFESNQGGFIVIQDADGNVLGQSSDLGDGLQENVPITLDDDLAEGDHDLTAVAYVGEDNPYDAEATATVTVPGEDVTPAFFSVSDLTPGVNIDEPGDAATISATVENTGEETGTQTVEVSVNGDVVDSEEITLEGGATHSVSVDLDTSGLDHGATYEYTVSTGDDSETGVINVAEEPEPEPTDDTDDEVVDEEDDADDDGAGFGIVVAALALLGAALLAVRRQVE